MSEYEALPGGCDPPNVDGVVALLRRYGLHGLGGCDGCRCAHFSLLGISVDVSCHKSDHCVRVHSGYMGFNQADLVPIVREALRQLPDGGAGYSVRFCDYSSDHVNGRWVDREWVEEHRCCYCAKPRADKAAYLCEECERDVRALESYPVKLLVLQVSLVPPDPDEGH
jgi:hypothetical protein